MRCKEGPKKLPVKSALLISSVGLMLINQIVLQLACHQAPEKNYALRGIELMQKRSRNHNQLSIDTKRVGVYGINNY